MFKPIAIALFAGGILLTVFGINAMNSFSSDIARFFTGAPTDRSIWMLVGGIAMILAGLVALFSDVGRSS